jgi:hypothetical protein
MGVDTLNYVSQVFYSKLPGQLLKRVNAHFGATNFNFLPLLFGGVICFNTRLGCKLKKSFLRILHETLFVENLSNTYFSCLESYWREPLRERHIYLHFPAAMPNNTGRKRRLR